MTQYMCQKGSLQARITPSSPITCDYHIDLIWVSAAWQAVINTGACARDDRWSRFASVPGLPNPSNVVAGTIMDDSGSTGTKPTISNLTATVKDAGIIDITWNQDIAGTILIKLNGINILPLMSGMQVSAGSNSYRLTGIYPGNYTICVTAA